MDKSEDIKELSAALVDLQGELPSVEMDKTNPYFNSRYATLGAVIKATKQFLHKYGFAITQLPINRVENGIVMIGVDTMLLHKSGQFLRDVCYVPMEVARQDGEESGKKQSKVSPAQKAGISISYLKRYAYVSILGLYTEEDTDGNLPNESSSHDPNVVAKNEIIELITANGQNKDVAKKYREIFKVYEPSGDLNKVESSNYPKILDEMKKVKGE